jgi:rubrerythrin
MSEVRVKVLDGAPSTMEEFMTFALEMEREAVERYTEFADTLATHNNKEVAELFRTMAGYEARHAQEIMKQMGWTEQTVLPKIRFNWPGFEAPETVPIDEVHYLMRPYHALQLALAAEERAQRFFAELASRTSSESVRKAALEMKAEEQEHAAMVKAWLAKVPAPEGNWAEDPDPPINPD